MTTLIRFFQKYPVLIFLILAAFLPACSGASAIPTTVSAPVETAMAPVTSAVADAVGPEYPELPEYPDSGEVAPLGVYQAPKDVTPTQWVTFPAYPNNAMLLTENPSNCIVDQPTGWEFCSYAFHWQVSLYALDNSVGVEITPSKADGYMQITSAVSGASALQMNESQSLAVSDGTSVFVVRMTASWDITFYTFDVALLNQ
jgi:hypothetical protein